MDDCPDGKADDDAEKEKWERADENNGVEMIPPLLWLLLLAMVVAEAVVNIVVEVMVVEVVESDEVDRAGSDWERRSAEV